MAARLRLRRGLAVASCLAALSGVVLVQPATGATLPTVTTASGSAYGIKASGAFTALTLALVPVNVPETPTVATTNSSLTSTKTLASAYVPTLCSLFTPTCVVNAHVARVSTRNAAGATGSSVASSDLADVSLLFDLLKLKAVHAECKADKAGLTMAGGALVVPSLPLALVPTDVALPDTSAPAPNTVIPLGSGTTVVGTLTLNEQIDTSTATRNSGEVNAVHLNLPPGSALSLTGLDVIVGHAACSAA